MTDEALEQEIQRKGLTAPRLTSESIAATVASEYFFTAAQVTDARNLAIANQHPSLRLLTICVLVLTNGFTVVGKSSCASPENFDAEIGRRIARMNALDQIWPLEGYLLKQRLHEAP